MSDLKSLNLAFGERIGSGGSDAILSGYFRDILLNLGIDVGRFQALLDRYIISQGIATNTVEIYTSRSALRREFMNQTMTWKVFVKALMFLKTHKVTIEIILHRDESEPSVHEYTFELTEQKEESEEPNVLAVFFKKIQSELGIKDDSALYQNYLDHYVKFSKPGSSTVEQYTAKCSLRREISKSNISWKVFIKGIIFLRTFKVNFKLRLFHRNDLVSDHIKTLVFR